METATDEEAAFGRIREVERELADGSRTVKEEARRIVEEARRQGEKDLRRIEAELADARRGMTVAIGVDEPFDGPPAALPEEYEALADRLAVELMERIVGKGYDRP
jgi:hypothetical protein